MLRSETRESLQRLERGQLRREELSDIVVQITVDLADLVRLSGAVISSLRQPPISPSKNELPRNDHDRPTSAATSDQIVFRIAEGAKMLGVSRSSLYEMINRREIGVVRFRNRAMRVPRSEIDNLLAGSVIR
jgi:excisionase family DNA binding protein